MTNKNTQQTFNPFLFPHDQKDQFDEFMTIYGDRSRKSIFREIMRVKSEVSGEVVQQHVNNLDHLSQMNGFTTDEVNERMNFVKKILTADTPLSNRRFRHANPETQFYSGSSLLLWFLILVAIW